eukprot:5196004-Prymnesium_polylepis.1
MRGNRALRHVVESGRVVKETVKGIPTRMTPQWCVLPDAIVIGLPIMQPQPVSSSANCSARSVMLRSSQLNLRPLFADSRFGQSLNIWLAASAVTSSISNPVCCEPPAVAPPAGIRMQRWR